MNHREFGKLLTDIQKMTKKNFSPSQVISLTSKYVGGEINVPSVTKPRGRPKQSKDKTYHFVTNTVTLPKPKPKANGKGKISEEESAVKHVLAKLCKEPLDAYDGTVFQYLMGFNGNISIVGLKKSLSLTGDEVRLQASLYKGMNKKVIDRQHHDKDNRTWMYFTVKDNLSIMKTIISRINKGGSI